MRSQAPQFERCRLLDSQLPVATLEVRSEAAGMACAQPSRHLLKVLKRCLLVEPDGARVTRSVVDEAVAKRRHHFRGGRISPHKASQQLKLTLEPTRRLHHPDVIR